MDDLAVAEGEDGDVAVAVGGAGGHDLARGGVLQDDMVRPAAAEIIAAASAMVSACGPAGA